MLSALLAKLQLIPARGRKRLERVASGKVQLVATYPREGTETQQRINAIKDKYSCNLSPRGDGNFNRLKHVPLPVRCNLSPRGDGNLVLFLFLFLGLVATYPREGTETVNFSGVILNTFRLQLIPARGRKHDCG